MQSKRFKFVFQELSNSRSLSNQKKLIILKKNFLISGFKKKIKKYTRFFSSETCFFLPETYNKADLSINTDIIYYPIKFIDFENSLLKIFKRQKTTFNNLEIKNYNSLFNNNNNKQIHLTEIESKILLLLFKNNVVRKKILNKKILHQSDLIDSKSLESHLYRLRKKLINIDSKKKIVLIENQGLKII